jgi:hypothetical protein
VTVVHRLTVGDVRRAGLLDDVLEWLGRFDLDPANVSSNDRHPIELHDDGTVHLWTFVLDGAGRKVEDERHPGMAWVEERIVPNGVMSFPGVYQG